LIQVKRLALSVDSINHFGVINVADLETYVF